MQVEICGGGIGSESRDAFDHVTVYHVRKLDEGRVRLACAEPLRLHRYVLGPIRGIGPLKRQSRVEEPFTSAVGHHHENHVVHDASWIGPSVGISAPTDDEVLIGIHCHRRHLVTGLLQGDRDRSGNIGLSRRPRELESDVTQPNAGCGQAEEIGPVRVRPVDVILSIEVAHLDVEILPPVLVLERRVVRPRSLKQP